jgi:ESCRT-II complex subunit VPS22
MCTSIGVDPLASQKGFWAEILGVGDFYYELGVQIIDVCLRTRAKNGGLLELASLQHYLNAVRPKASQSVSVDDIERSIAKLKILGSGFSVKKIGIPPNELKVVQSVALELNQDHTLVFQTAVKESDCCVDVQLLKSKLNWERARSVHVLEFLEYSGLAWIDDDPVTHKRTWYFPSLFPDLLG